MNRLVAVLLVLGLTISSNIISHQLRKTAQSNETLYSIMLSLDAADFVMSGGGGIGYANHFKWEYARWRSSPDRTFLERILFWDRGFFYDASNPPEEYSYPPLFEES